MADLVHAAGRAVAVPLAALARARGAKPMHPRGVLFDALLERRGPAEACGIGWLDATGTDDVLVRLSRGAGLPSRLPDLLGFALRLPGEPPVDLLLSSTGQGRWTRRVPVPRRDAATAYGSIMAYRSPAGPVWLAAVPDGGPLPSDPHALAVAGPGRVVTLSAAVGRGPWQPFATVTLRAPTDPLDPALHFDAVLHAPPGLGADGPLARFRRPAYAAARAAQGADAERGSGAR
jgi:hypothetical protein